MGHLTLELILWLLLAFFIGCTLGCLFRKMFGGSSSATDTTDAPVALKAEREAEKATDSKTKTKTKTKTKPEAKTATATGVAKRPKGLAAARGGKADKLTRVSGIGAKLEKTLHSLGYFHFSQIAAWTPDEVQWVDEHLRFKGRIERDEWLAQSSLIADGKEEEFTKLYGSGAVKDKKPAQSKSDSQTKKK